MFQNLLNFFFKFKNLSLVSIFTEMIASNAVIKHQKDFE